MEIKEIREEHFSEDNSSKLESVVYEITAQEGYYLVKDNYRYGNTVITDNPNGWKEYPEEED